MQVPKPKSKPGLFLYTLTFLATALIIRVFWTVAGQNIENVASDTGYDKLLSRHWAEILAWFAVNGFWLSLVTAFVVGAALAAWVMVLLSPKAKPVVTGLSDEERRALADRADILGRRIQGLAGEYAGEHRLAWGQDDGAPFERTGAVDVRYLRRFGDECAPEFYSIIAEARKGVVIPALDEWPLKQGVTSASSIQPFGQFMARLAALLRHPHEDVLTIEGVEEMKAYIAQMQRHSMQQAQALVSAQAELAELKAATLVPQSLPGTGAETQP